MFHPGAIWLTAPSYIQTFIAPTVMIASICASGLVFALAPHAY